MELIQNILVTVMLAVWILVSAGFFVGIIQNIIHERKSEQREQDRNDRDLEYHKKRMNDFK